MKELNKLSKAMAMQCFGRMVEIVENDPDPNAQDELAEEYNCKNCDSYQFCHNLTLLL